MGWVESTFYANNSKRRMLEEVKLGGEIIPNSDKSVEQVGMHALRYLDG